MERSGWIWNILWKQSLQVILVEEMTTELVKRGIKNNSKIFSSQQADMGLFIQIGKNRGGTHSLERRE